MKEQYSPIDPIKKSVKITGILARSVFEEVKPTLKSVMTDQMEKVLRILYRE